MTSISNHQPYPQHLSHQPYPQHIEPKIKKTIKVKHGHTLSHTLFRIYINLWMPLHSTNYASIKFWVSPLSSKMDTCRPCIVPLIAEWLIIIVYHGWLWSYITSMVQFICLVPNVGESLYCIMVAYISFFKAKIYWK